MTLKPLSDRVLVEPSEADDVTSGGILLPDAAKEKPTKGKILAVGPGKLDDNGQVVAMSVKVGDTVLYEKYGGSNIKIDGKDRVIVRESEILAIVD